MIQLNPFKLRDAFTLDVFSTPSEAHHISMGDKQLTGATNMRQRSLRIQIVSQCPKDSARRRAVYQALFRLSALSELTFWQAEVVVRIIRAYSTKDDVPGEAFERLENAIVEYSRTAKKQN